MATANIGINQGLAMIPYAPESSMLAGAIISYSGSIAAFSTLTTDSTTLYYKDGWALCNGASISQATFAQLYARLSTTWNTAVNPLTGSAQSAPTSGYFRIPNLQGTFLRGVGDFTDDTKDVTLAGWKDHQFQGHGHSITGQVSGGSSAANITTGAPSSAQTMPDWSATTPTTTLWGSPLYGTETRPQNIGVYYLVKLYDNVAAIDVYIPSASASVTGLVNTAAQSFGGDKTFTGSITPSGGIVGKTDGVAVPAGKVGEVRAFTARAVSAVAGGDFESNTSALDTLPAGRWHVFGYVTNPTAGVTAISAVMSTNSTADGSGLLGINTIPGQRTLDAQAAGPLIPFIIDVATTQALYAKANTVGANASITIGGYAVRIA